MATFCLLRGSPLLSNGSWCNNPQDAVKSPSASCSLWKQGGHGVVLDAKACLQRRRECQVAIHRIAQSVSLCERSRGQGVMVNAQHLTPVPAQAQLEAERPVSMGITVGALAVQGLREEMEDELVVVETQGPDGLLYAGVFDGHAGFSSAQFLREELYKECIAALDGGTLLESSDSAKTEAALVHAFLQADRRLLSWLQESATAKQSGSTATVLFLRNGRLFVVHVGDSRAVLCQNGIAKELSEDHRPYGNRKTSIAEVNRIKEAGGWVTHGRVCGSLSVSRAFGNISLKMHRKEMLEEGVKKRLWTKNFVSSVKFTGDWVTASPAVYQEELSQDAEFIIVATDGLWDSLKSDEVVRVARRHLKKHGDVQRTCEALVQRALNRNGSDNIAIVMVHFGREVVEDDGPWWRKLLEYLASVLDL